MENAGCGRATGQLAARANSTAPVANQLPTARFSSVGLLAISQWFDLMTERVAFGSSAKLIVSCQPRLSSATTKRVGQDTLTHRGGVIFACRRADCDQRVARDARAQHSVGSASHASF